MTALPTKPAFSAADRAHMRAALGLARRGRGNTAPNPNVGCIIVHPALGVVGRGWTQPGGRPHAETEALGRAGVRARGAHAYVTLEPCDHQGQTGPCSQALIDAGIVAVTVATKDPDPRVSGSGLRRLETAGIVVRHGLMETAARRAAAGFLSVTERKRPWVTLKTATTLDGMIAAKTGRSQWITGPAARRRGHLLRSQNDAIATGIGTVLADDPQMTCRLPGLETASPLRLVLDTRGRLDASLRIVQDQDTAATIQIVAAGAPAIGGGIETITADTSADGHIDPTALLKILGARGVTRLLVEAGAAVSTTFIKHDLVDEIAWFRAPAVLGGDGIPAVAGFGLDSPELAARFSRIDIIPLDADVLERYLRADEKE